MKNMTNQSDNGRNMVHEAVINLHKEGYSNKYIAEYTGYPESTIRGILIREAKRNGDK